MGKKTKIEWTDRTWNPVLGCRKVSDACDRCYAERMHNRQMAMGNYSEPFNVIQTLEHRLKEPQRWTKAQRVFVCSMSDLFGEQVPDEFIMKVLHLIDSVAQASRQRGAPITFQLLTKRPQRMKERIIELHEWWASVGSEPCMEGIWLGVTAERTARWSERVPVLLNTPAKVRFVSVEPMLEDILKPIGLPKLDWVIIGGESGPGARYMDGTWVYQLINDCREAKVPVFFKQWGTHLHNRGKVIQPGFKQFPKGHEL